MSTVTKRQKQIYDYVKGYVEKRGYSPTFEEIRRHFKLSTLSTIHQHLEILAKKGFLVKNKYLARGVELKDTNEIIKIPLSGTITAGLPIEAIEIPNEFIHIPKNEFKKIDDLYALKVQGNSMIEEGIFDGDIVVIKKQPYAENGETVVAIIDDNEATLKKLYREHDKFRLQPANPTLFPIYRNEVEIRGVVVRIIRNLEHKIEIEKMDTNTLTRRNDYSWDFRGERTKSYTHGLHTYPAMFIPQVARRLLQIYSKKGDTVCDIFCGSGTALVESRLLGRNSYGVDLNPLAIFLAKIKITELDPSKLTKEYFSLLGRVKKIKDDEIQKPVFLNIDFWFKKQVIIQLAKIKRAINEINNKKIRGFFLVSFSETVRLASNTRNGEFKLFRMKEEQLKNYNPDVLSIFRKKTESNIKGMTNFYQNVDKKTWAKPILGDSSNDNNIKENSIDCIITSPPYGDSRTTVAYGQFSRLSAQWVDLFNDPNDASGVDNELLGGKSSKELKHNLKSNHLIEILDKIAKQDEKRAREVLSFYVDLNRCLIQAYRILKPNKYFCLVIGNRSVKQVRIPTDFIIAELGEKVGFACEDIVVRNIPGKRMPIKNSPTNIAGELEETMTKESVVILKKI